MAEPIAVFTGEIIRVKTMADGSPRFEIGGGESANVYLTPLSQIQSNNKLIKVIIYDYSEWERLEKENQ